MAFTPPIDHKFYATATITGSGGDQLIATARVIPSNATQTLRVRAWVAKSSNLDMCAYIDRVCLIVNKAGTVTVVTPLDTGSTGYVNGAGAAQARANPETDIAINSSDTTLSLDFTISSTQIRIGANQSAAVSHIWVVLVDETTITWT